MSLRAAAHIAVAVSRCVRGHRGVQALPSPRDRPHSGCLLPQSVPFPAEPGSCALPDPPPALWLPVLSRSLGSQVVTEPRRGGGVDVRRYLDRAEQMLSARVSEAGPRRC